jgi:hypothetical protein
LLVILAFWLVLKAGQSLALGGVAHAKPASHARPASYKAHDLEVKTLHIYGPPFQADKQLIDFVKARAIELRKEWRQQGMPLWPKIIAEFWYDGRFRWLPPVLSF